MSRWMLFRIAILILNIILVIYLLHLLSNDNAIGQSKGIMKSKNYTLEVIKIEKINGN